MSPADPTPFPLIKSLEIFHLSVSRPWRVAAASSQVCLLTVSFHQFTLDADNIIMASLMFPRIALVQPFVHVS